MPDESPKIDEGPLAESLARQALGGVEALTDLIRSRAMETTDLHRELTDLSERLAAVENMVITLRRTTDALAADVENVRAGK